MATREKKKAEKRKAARAKNGATAALRDVGMSSRKVRVVADLVRGVKVEEALNLLTFQRRSASEPLKSVLNAAVANANEKGMNLDRLVVSEIQVHGGPIRRRFLSRAQGRADRIRRRTTHVEVKVQEKA